MKRSYFLSFSFPLTRVGHFPSRLEVEQRGETLDLILLCQGLLSGGINLAQFDVAAKFNLLERTSFSPRKAREIQLGSGGNSRGRMEDICYTSICEPRWNKCFRILSNGFDISVTHTLVRMVSSLL